MPQPTEWEIRSLSQVADELREVFAERGYRVDVALDEDPAFGSGMSRASLARDLAVQTIGAAASRAGIDFRPIPGGGLELHHLEGVTDRRYRVRKAHRNSEGSLRIPVNSASAIRPFGDTVFHREQWALAWVLSADGLIEEVLIAEVRGLAEGNPGHLLLGPTIALGEGDLPTGGFEPADEDLDGFDDESDEGFGGSA